MFLLCHQQLAGVFLRPFPSIIVESINLPSPAPAMTQAESPAQWMVSVASSGSDSAPASPSIASARPPIKLKLFITNSQPASPLIAQHSPEVGGSRSVKSSASEEIAPSQSQPPPPSVVTTRPVERCVSEEIYEKGKRTVKNIKSIEK